MLAVNPDLVDMTQLEGQVGEMNLVNDVSETMPTDGWSRVLYKGVHVDMPRDAVRYAANGWIGPDHAKTASKEWGDAMMAGTADYIVDFLKEFRQIPLPEPLPVRCAGKPGAIA